MASLADPSYRWAGTDTDRVVTMALKSFNYDAPRATQARLAKRLGGRLTQLLLFALQLALVLFGATLLWLGVALGWLIVSLASPVAVVVLWQRRHLSKLPSVKGETMDARLEADLLSHLPKDLTPKTLAVALAQTRSAQFVMVRTGLSVNFVGDVSSDDPSLVGDVWAKARVGVKAGQIVSGARVLVALVHAQPSLKLLLPHLQLDEADLDNVNGWYDHLSHLIDEHGRVKATGGIARDWSFGYTPLLGRFGQNITERVVAGGLLNVDLESHQDALDMMIRTFSARGRQNVALVGPLGAGKTSVVHAFAERLLAVDSGLPSSLKFRQVISLDAAALISAAKGRGDLEELMSRLLVEAHKAKNIILCLDDAQLFFEEGVGSVDLSNILLPVLEGGVLRIVLTMEEQRWLQIAARNPSLANALNRVVVAPASPDETLAVLQDQLISLEFQKKVTYMYQSLKESIRLSERYLYDQSQPGKALKVLELAGDHADNGLVTAVSVQKAVERTMGVKVGASASGEEKKRLLKMEELIHERMINQTYAVGVVSDALRRARAGVRNEKRPIGTFLFLGPTGVGKTELAKSLAAVYFNGEDHLIRLDLNEFVQPGDVSRLLADGADDPFSLSAQVMKQPFSVILLDEIEKAHDSVLATLLQVLDEGILRDIKGREISFRDTIIIATSNAGADMIRHHIDAGEELEDFEKEFSDDLISSKQFRPEFLNRFDEIVLFRPLGVDELKQIVDLIIAGINRTLEPQKVILTVDDDAKAKLIKKGHDPKLGARPLRRAVQRTVESLIAKRMLEGSVQPGDTIAITASDIAD